MGGLASGARHTHKHTHAHGAGYTSGYFTAWWKEVGKRREEQQVDGIACIPPSCHATAVFCQPPPHPTPALPHPHLQPPSPSQEEGGGGLFTAGLRGGMRTTYCYWKFGLVCVSM